MPKCCCCQAKAKYDVDGDSVYDLEVTLKDIVGGLAKLNIQSISETMPSEDTTTTPSDTTTTPSEDQSDIKETITAVMGSAWTWWLIGLLVLVAIILLVIFRKKE